MRHKNQLLVTAICYLLTTFLFGCTTIKEMGKGFIGVSTEVLESKRKGSLKKSFALDYNSCYKKVKELLKSKETQAENAPYIYAEDLNKKMIALYLSQTDTTPVGIFFTEEAKNKTLIEVSSPSVYAKELIAKDIFTGLDTPLKPEENKTNVKEEVSN